MILKFLASLLAAIVAFCAPAYAACTGTGTCTLLDNGSVGPVPAAALPNGVISNIYLAKTANYTVGTSDAGSTISLSGGFFTLTFSAPSGYASTFCAQVINADTTRAKKLSISGGTDYFLWPGQQDIICNSNNVWKSLNGPHRWVTSNATCYVDNVNGTVVGSTDGLASGTGAFNSFQGCYQNALKSFDTNGTLFYVNLTAGQTYTTANDFTFNGTVTGSQGLVIYGNASTISVSSGSSQAAVNYTGPSGQVSIANVSVGCSVSACADFSISYPGELNVYSPVTFNASTGPHLQSSGAGSVLYVTGMNYNSTPTANVIAGNGMEHLQAVQNGFMIDYSTSNTLSANVTFSAGFVYAAVGGIVQGAAGSAYPITLGSYSVTAQRYIAQTGGNISNTGGCGASYFPGNSAGIATGGFCN